AGLVREVIVADAGSADATGEVADVAGCRLLSLRAPLAERLRQAAASARAPWLLFVRPGVVLDGGWVEEAIRFIKISPPSASSPAAAVFRRPPARAWSAEAWWPAWMLIRARPHPDQCLLIAKADYQRLGGHSDGAGDPEAALLGRLARGITVLRSTAVRT
ncbi:MAG: glycosyl transferase, partial [Dehalococcoidia bacterium]|nr:glycosyl transferase [Dehalococcoidia bacterium]